jgi:hypothetical protein
MGILQILPCLHPAEISRRIIESRDVIGKAAPAKTVLPEVAPARLTQ